MPESAAADSSSPAILEHPASLSVTEPDGAIFSVTASGHEPLSYQWLWDGEPMKAVTPSDKFRTAYFTLDETEGFVYADYYGNLNGHCADGEEANCPTPVSSGRINGGQRFDGASTGINVQADPAFDWSEADSFSVELWIKKENGQTCTENGQTIIGRHDIQSGFHWSLGCVEAEGLDHFFFQLRDSHDNERIILSTKHMTPGAWHHVAAVRDGTDNVMRLHVDGTDIVTGQQNFSGSFSSEVAPLYIGHLGLANHFSGILDEIALYRHALPIKEIRAHAFLSRNYAEICESPLRIMPAGDSITKGQQSGVENENCESFDSSTGECNEKMISYRKDLWDQLLAAGHVMNFVGSQEDGWFYDFDHFHEGHGGKTDSWLSVNIYSFLVNNPADYVLVHIGTNNRSDDDPQHVAHLLDEIKRYENSSGKSVTVVLARIINRLNKDHAITTSYNNAVASMAQERIENGDKIIIVDMEDGAGLNYLAWHPDTRPDGDMWDNLHPYATGYSKMAELWFETLNMVLPECNHSVRTDILALPQTRAASDNGRNFSVVVSNAYGSITSLEATLTVQPTLYQYTLTYTAGSGGTVSGETSQTVDHGSDGAQVEAVPDAGRHFTQWSDGSTQNPRLDANVTADISVVAHFALNQYVVTFMDHDGEVLKTQNVNHGGSATAPEAPLREGHTFTGWDNAFDNITEDLVVTALYAINTYTVRPSTDDPNGSITPDTEQTVNHGATATFTVTPAPGYTATVAGTCEGTLDGTTYTTDPITEDCTVVATFSLITFSTIGGTVSGLADGNQVVLQNNGGDNLTVSADGPFTFDTPLANGSSYNVTVLTHPTEQNCTVTNGRGTVTGTDVTDVQVTCKPREMRVPIPAIIPLLLGD